MNKSTGKPHITLRCEILEDRRLLASLLPSITLPVLDVVQSAPLPGGMNTAITPNLSSLLNTAPGAVSASQPSPQVVTIPLFTFPVPEFVFRPVSVPSNPVTLPFVPPALPPAVVVPPASTLPGSPVSTFGGTPQNGTNPPVTPPTIVTPPGTPTPAAQTIGLLAFPLIPGYPVGMAYYASAQPIITPLVNGVPPPSARTPEILEDSLGAYWLPVEDEPLLTPEQADEQRWNPDIPPVDAAPGDTKPAPAEAGPQQTPGSPAMAAPPVDADVSWNNIPTITRTRAIEQLLRDADQVRPAEIALDEGWAYGLMAAGLAGTLAPELAGAADKKQTEKRGNQRARPIRDSRSGDGDGGRR
jgi:hypothetical protein